MGRHDNTQDPVADASVELTHDAWERFERAVDTVSKSGPQHRVRIATLSQQKEMEVHPGADWQEWGFDNESAVVEVQTSSPLPHLEVNQSGRRVVAWIREIERGIELSFDPPT
jgi:hypothetical protein